MRPPTPETISIITSASGSTRIWTSTLKSPPVNQVYAVDTCERSPESLPHAAKRATTAPPNATKVESVEIQPAMRRVISCPRKVIVRQPTSGAARQTQAPAIILGVSRDYGARRPAKTEQAKDAGRPRTEEVRGRLRTQGCEGLQTASGCP